MSQVLWRKEQDVSGCVGQMDSSDNVLDVLFSVFALLVFCIVEILTLPSKSYLPTTFSTLLGAGLMRGVVSR